MRKGMAISLIGSALFIVSTISHADTSVVTTTTQNTHAGSANTQTSTDTKKQEAKKDETSQQSNQNSSVYDNIRWGWNKFIDVLAGPAQPK